MLFTGKITISQSGIRISGSNGKYIRVNEAEWKRAMDYMKKRDCFCNLFFLWELRESNPRPSACKADALNQLS